MLEHYLCSCLIHGNNRCATDVGSVHLPLNERVEGSNPKSLHWKRQNKHCTWVFSWASSHHSPVDSYVPPNSSAAISNPELNIYAFMQRHKLSRAWPNYFKRGLSFFVTIRLCETMHLAVCHLQSLYQL